MLATQVVLEKMLLVLCRNLSARLKLFQNKNYVNDGQKSPIHFSLFSKNSRKTGIREF